MALRFVFVSFATLLWLLTNTANASADAFVAHTPCSFDNHIFFGDATTGVSGSGSCDGGGSYAYRQAFGPDGLILGASAVGNASEAIYFFDYMHLTGGPLTPNSAAMDCAGVAEVDCIGYLRVEMSVTGSATSGGYGQLWIADPSFDGGQTFTFFGDTTVTTDVPFCLNAPACFNFGDDESVGPNFLNIELRAIANGGTADFLSTATMTSVQVLNANKLPLSGGGIASTLTYPVRDQVTPVPEPGTLMLLGVGLSVVASQNRRRGRTERA